MEFIMPNMTFTVIIAIVIGAWLLIQGLAQLVTGKVFGGGYDKYTEESLKKFARPSGACMVIIGAAFLLKEFIVFPDAPNLSMWLGLGIAVVFLIILIIMTVTMLKKKDGAQSKKGKK